MSILFAGLDVSTQSCKLVILDWQLKEVVYVDSVNYDTDLPQYHTHSGVLPDRGEGVSESNPEMWIEAVNMVFANLKKSNVDAGQVRSISVSGQQHGLVALDKEGNLTLPFSKLWNDFSTQEECDILTDKLGGPEAMIKEVGNSQRTGYTAAKIFHMVRHDPEQYLRTNTLFLVHNYINWFLTGGVRVMEPGDTSGTALWNPATGSWSEKVIKAIDPCLSEKLPEVLPSDQSIGRMSGFLVNRFGFSSECTVDAGCGDNMYSAVGTGNVMPGIVTISLGTSGTAFSFSEEPFIDPDGEIASFCDSTGHYLPLLCVSNMAGGYNETLRKYDINHDAFNRIIGETKAGNGGRLIIPWYGGERTPDLPQAAPLYFGFGLDDFTPQFLCRGVLEGHVLNIFDGFQKMEIEATEIRLTGGLSQSPAWCQTIADVFDTEVLPVKGEGAALGAALHAAWVWIKEKGESKPIEEVVTPFLELDEAGRRRPIPENVSIYKKQKKLFHALSARVRGLNGDDPFRARAELL
ncbi:hypothetical protein J7K93_09610 [bacterium]|nr:hypothetical protein [bacterium]